MVAHAANLASPLHAGRKPKSRAQFYTELWLWPTRGGTDAGGCPPKVASGPRTTLTTLGRTGDVAGSEKSSALARHRCRAIRRLLRTVLGLSDGLNDRAAGCFVCWGNAVPDASCVFDGKASSSPITGNRAVWFDFVPVAALLRPRTPVPRVLLLLIVVRNPLWLAMLVSATKRPTALCPK